MDQNFQTSFIPKKPMIEERSVSSRPIGFFMIVSIFIFFVVLIATGGLYFYERFLKTSVEKMQKDLDLAQNRFEPSKIIQLQFLDKRLKASTEILSKHTAISPIFKALQDITMKSVSYSKFSYALDDTKGNVLVSMSGVATGYTTIALQADLFKKNKYLIDPIFSNLSLNEKGNVIFDLNFSVDPNLINYQKKSETSDNNSNTSLDNIRETIN